MPLAAIFLGALIIDLALRGTEHKFAAQLGQDFGSGSTFYAWAASITILGGAGYIKPLKPFTDPLLALVIVVVALRNGGLFTQLKTLVTNPPAPSQAVALSSYPAPSFNVNSSSSGSSSGGGAASILGSSDTGGTDYAEIASLAALAA